MLHSYIKGGSNTILFLLIRKWSLRLVCVLFVLSASCNKSIEKPIDNATTLFTLVTSENSGIDFANTLTETAEENHLLNENFVTGAGVAIGDINNDGLPDIYFAGNQVHDRLYLNRGNMEFEDITEKAGILKTNSWSTGVTFADVNSDGFQDIYVCKNEQKNRDKSTNLLYINSGNGTFKEMAEHYGVDDKGFSTQASFLDYDKNGLIDLYVINQPPGYGNRQGGKKRKTGTNPMYSDKLYRNLGPDIGFIEVSPMSKTENLAFGLSVAVGDLNNDGWQDMYVANDYNEPDFYYVNNTKGAFKESLKTHFKHISNFSMGTDIADFDNDGNLDIMVLDMVAEDHKRIKTNMGGMNPKNFWNIVAEGGHYQYMFNTLQKNNGNGSFSDVAQMAGVSNTDWSWGPLIADFDNDGLKDLFVTNGIKRNMRNSDVNKKYERLLDSIDNLAKKENKKFEEVVDVLSLAKLAPEDKLQNYIYKNNGDLTFEKQNKKWGFELETLSNGAAYADLDQDGDLDLVVNNIDEKAFIYENHTVDKNKGNYLRINLFPSTQTEALGSRVVVYKDTDPWQTIEVTNVRGYMSKSENTVHFGLGELMNVEKIRIQWPNGQVSELKNIKANQSLDIHQKNEEFVNTSNISVKPIFKENTVQTNLKYKHQENTFDDYQKQVLLPHKMSQFGPTIAVADVNSDGLEDFYVGGASGKSGMLFVQNTRGQFDSIPQKDFLIDKTSEDLGSLFFDIDNDGDQDLFVVSGGYEFQENSKHLQDRLYLNDGTGYFSKDNSRLPKYLESGSQVISADYDKDGDLDLFVAGRQIPGKYPSPANSILLENDNGYLKNVTEAKAPGFMNLGMVTSAQWAHINDDDRLDLIVVGEWMPITTFLQTKNGTFEPSTIKGLEKTNGWYYSVTKADMDNDGDDDFIVGNLGLNYKYKATPEHPFQVHSADFDKNGKQDIVLSYFEEGEVYPIRGRSCSVEQIPELDAKFPTFESFGDSDLKDIYGNQLNDALHLSAYTFASYYIENIDGKSFTLHELPKLAQVSSINSILAEDFDKDGHKDLLIAGNLFTSEIETTRNDAGIGLFLKGNGKGDFFPITTAQSGFYAPFDVKNMKIIKKKGKSNILIGNNNHYLQLMEYN
ncbi:VCBS repeat-containing protein [Zobellia sp. 1_MG-2023]|uniref:VCBS repeat-containing protein n=1 Tax=Zobellia sp. 1_MG-2023 TaxID=3062626 RepID=UPI0026E3848F|nr:VCBS repeat-containing protein [Zobellia sp. 1_MG-2023]MDO6819136.1 VCBS repeat-containing protein [Zobellia sp. 1_MG-2023]